jgi:hypothetical protein
MATAIATLASLQSAELHHRILVFQPPTDQLERALDQAVHRREATTVRQLTTSRKQFQQAQATMLSLKKRKRPSWRRKVPLAETQLLLQIVCPSYSIET